MGIMWNQLQNQTMPSVVAQLPMNNQPSQLDSLAGGIMQGLQTASSIQANNAQTELTNKRGQLADIEIKNAQDARDHAVKLQAAASQSRDAYLQAADVNEKLTFMGKEAELSNLMSSGKKMDAETTKIQTDNNNQALMNIGQVYAAGDAAFQKGGQALADKVLNYGKSQLPDQQRKMVGDKFDAGEANAAMYMGQQALFSHVQANAKDTSDPLVKKQQVRNSLQDRVASGQGSDQDKQDLKELNAAIAATGRGTQQMTPSEKVSIKVAQQRLITDNNEVKTHRDNQASAKLMLSISDKADAGALSTYKMQIGNIANSVFGLKLDPKVPMDEAFNQISRQFQVNTQSLMKGQTSDRDMKIMAELSPQLGNTSQGRKLMANIISYRANGGIQQVAFENAWVSDPAHNGSIAGMDEAWSKFLNTRSDVKVTKDGANFTEYTQKDWKPFLDESYEAPKQEQQITPTSQISPDAARQEAIRRGLIKQ